MTSRTSAGTVPLGKIRRSPARYLPTAVLLASSAVLLVWWHELDVRHREGVSSHFRFETRRITTKVEERMDSYVEILRGTVGLFDASPQVRREDFRRYVEGLDLQRAYPGIQEVAFAVPVSASGLDEHVRAVRGEGFPAYAVWPQGARSEYSSVLYLEPFAGRNLRAFGFDMLTEPVRRAALERTRDTGEIVLSGRVRLAQETEADAQAGELLYEAVYAHGAPHGTVAERRAALLGWACSVFRMNDLMQSMLESDLHSIRLELFDGPADEPASLLFDSRKGSESGPAGRSQPAPAVDTVHVADRVWTLRYTALSAFVAASPRPAWWVELAAVGLILWLLVAVTWALVNTRRRAEAIAAGLTRSLHLSEALYRDTFERAPVGIAQVSRDRRFLRVNRRYAEIMGYTPEELLGLSAEDRIHPDDLNLDDDVRDRVWAGQAPSYTTEKRYVRKDGSLLWGRLTVSLQPELEGEPAQFIGVLEDVTDRRKAEEALHRSSADLRKLWQAVEQTPATVVITDLEGRIDYVNPRFTEVTGYTAQEALGQNPRILKSDRTPPEVHKALWEAITAGRVWQGELCNKKKDGTQFWEQASISPVRDEHGITTNYVAVKEDITAQKRAAEELRTSEDRFRGLIERAPIAIGLARHGVTLYANPKYLEMYGFENVDEVRGRSIGEQFAESCRAEIEERARQRAEGLPVPDEYEAVGQRKDGSTFPMHVAATIVQLADGPCTAGFLTDLTQRKRAEDVREAVYRISEAAAGARGLGELFERAREILGTLIPTQNFYVALVDKGAGTIYFPYFVDEVDPPPAEMPLGRGLTEYVIRTGEPLLANEEIHRDLAARGEAELVGAPSIEWLGAPLKASGETIGAVVVQTYSAGVQFTASDKEFLTFISSQLATAIVRKLAEEELRKVEAKYRSIFENALEGIFQNTPDGRFITVNPSFARMLGYASPEELLEPVHDIEGQLWVHTEKRQEYRGLLETQGFVKGYEVELWRKDHSVVWVSESSRVVRGPTGAIEYYEGSVEDITERKRLEAELVQAQKMEAVGRLAGGIAHDFNNLLTVIQGYAELLGASLANDSERGESMGEIVKAAERAAALTRQLLAFSRRQVLETRVLDLGAVVADAEKMLRRLIGEDVEVVVVKPATLGRVKADPGQIEQVLLNLAVNSRDAMPGGGRLTVELADVTLDEPLATSYDSIPSGRYVVVSVRDTGSGMDAETLAHLFEPFFTTKEKGKGTGLGLATVFGVVKQSGGYVDVASAPGVGTTVRVYLPHTDARTTSGVRPRVSSRPGSETVLVVEDEAAVRNLVRAVLERKGYEVLTASDGAGALELVDRHAGVIHVLLTDIVMPGMSGNELAALVTERRPTVKAILMSGYTDNVPAELGTEGGPAFLSKPFTESALTSKLREVLDTPSSAPPHN